MTLRQIAAAASRTLADDIYQGANLWPLVDRIERRFRIQGAAEHEVNRLRDAHKDWLAAQLDRLPDWRKADRASWLR